MSPPSPLSPDGPGCVFCGYALSRPQLVVAESGRWVLAHVDRFWPEGSLYLFPREHRLMPELSAEDWLEASPFLARAGKLLQQVSLAERVYLGAFSEVNPHFHLLMVPKTAKHSESHGGKKAAALLEAFVGADRPLDWTTVADLVSRYRSSSDGALDVPDVQPPERK